MATAFGIFCLVAGSILLGAVVGIILGEGHAERKHAAAIGAWRMIEMLRNSEGAAVTINCDNPDFEGPNSVVEICDDWTDWKPRRFEGDSVVDCLETALNLRGVH